MADVYEDDVSGVAVVAPNYEPWTAVTVTNTLTTNVTTTAKRRVSFDTADYDIRVLFSGANTQGVCQITLPSGDVIDANAFVDPTNLVIEQVGLATIVDADGLSRGMGGVFPNTNTTIRVYNQEASVGATFVASTPLKLYNNTVDSSANRPIVFAASDEIRIRFSVPLVRLQGGFSAYGTGRATSVKDGLLPATSTLGLLRYHTSNGYGSSASSVRRLSTLLQNTGDVVYADSASAGTSFTIQTAGLYTISYTDMFSAAANMGISKNASSLSTTIDNLTVSERLIMTATSGASLIGSVSCTVYLEAGSVIRPHANGTTTGAVPAAAMFSIQRLS